MSTRCKAGGFRCKRKVAVLEYGLCVAHYKRLQRTKKIGDRRIAPHEPLPLYTPPNAVKRPGICSVRGCGGAVDEYPSHKLCRPHYERYRVQVRVQKRARKDINLKPIEHRKKKAKAA